MGVLSSIFPKRGAQSGAAYRDGVSDELVEQTRARARNRLIGAAVLVLVGVVVLPMLFDTEPRPLSGDTRVDVARPAPAAEPRPATPATETPSSSTAAAPATPAEVPPTKPPAPAVAAVAPVPRPTPAPAPEHKPDHKAAEPKPAVRAETPPKPAEREAAPAKPAARPAPEPADARARALLEGREPAAAAGSGRFVVQVAAYADHASMAAARGRLDKLGLKTYTQDVKTSSGPRIRLRVGPFSDRDDAERALARIKGAGLPGSVLTL